MSDIMDNKRVQKVSLIQESTASYILLINFFLLLTLLIAIFSEGNNFSAGFNRAGIVLQFIAGLSIIPQILDTETREKANGLLKKLKVISNNPSLILKLTFSLVTIILIIVAGWFSLLITAHYLRFFVIIIFGVFTLTELTSIITLIFKTKIKPESFAIHSAILISLDNFFQLEFEKLILRISLPLFIFGCIFQFLSTYI
ncbi:MAG TPA: hypothetical protein DHW49_09200 [Anaerolineae bacterium]|nr:hypothetical protein [Anaerolineae bacterium]